MPSGLAPSRLALIAALLAVTALAGCGRKGLLELPPSAQTAPPPQSSAPMSMGEHVAAGAETAPEEGQADPRAVKHKRFFLDPILN